MARSSWSTLVTVAWASYAVALFGPIDTARPNPAGGSVANTSPPSPFFQGTSGPYPTNDWWVGYGAAPAGDAFVAGPFPYQSRLANDSIHFGISGNRQFDGTSVKQPSQDDWSAGFTEHSGRLQDHKLVSYDTQSVTLQYVTGSSSLTSYMVPGSPYITLNYASATPLFTSQNGLITSFAGTAVSNGGAAVSSTGTKFKVLNNAGTYIIYALNGPLTLSAVAINGAGTITAGAKYSGVIRMVKLNSAAHESTLDTYVANYPTGVTTDYSFSGDTGTLTFTWAVQGNAANLLQLSWPHHRLALQNPNFLPTSSLSYLTTKGNMYPVLGNVWRLQYALPAITWNAPRDIHPSCSGLLSQGLEYEINKTIATPPTAPGDFYWFGGNIGAKSRLALIADHAGRSDLVTPMVNWLKTAMNFWFQPSSPTQAAYETAWGGIINKAGATDTGVDYGNGYYNDHHFHYGYFLAAAATIAKFDPAWMNTNRNAINLFLRDIVNPSRSDPFFPVTRHRDWFAGHSWASGIANGAGARDQESIGEAVNGYYGALLWATATGNTDIAQYARLLVATEQQAAKVYWHMDPASDSNGRDQPYPEQGVRNLVTIGNVEDWQSGAWLFWGDQRVEIAAIQILPVTPINEYMYETTWATNMYNYTSGELASSDFGDEWKSVIYLAYSQVDPQTAASRSAALTSWGTGNTYSNQLYFLATRPNPSGRAICSSATANPEGTFILQAVSNNRYVTSSAARNELVADGSSAAAATPYQFSFSPNAGTMRAVNTNQFVTADISGTFTIAAARATADTWENFVIRPKLGGASGTYTLMAASNKGYVVLSDTGALVNNGATESAATAFRFVASSGTPAPPTPPTSPPTSPSGPQTPLPPSGTLQHDATGQFVTIGTPLTDPWLRTSASGSGTAWNFNALTVSNGVPITGIQEADNKMYVTSDDAGADQLRAFREVASTWEYFAFEGAGGCRWNLRMPINGKLVGVRADGSLFADQTVAGPATTFKVVGAGCPA